FPLKFFTFMDDLPTFEVILENGDKKKLEGKSYFKEGLRNEQYEPSFSIDGKNAIIKIPSWEDNTAGPFNYNLEDMASTSKLGKFIRESIEEAINAQSEHLIIDLSGNKGGKSGPAAILLSYLINKPFKYYSEIKVTSNHFPTKEHITNKELVALYESSDAKALINEIDGEFFFKEEILPFIEPKTNQFEGTVELLVDKYSLSVSTDVVAVLKKNREVEVTGDEIGGSLEHYCAGNYLNLKLPHSGIEVNIPIQRLKY
ncbi:MAG: S41 family peptidase, partial [Bacteroidota bacterium]